MSSYVYVDNSNVWIEGMHVAAVESGLAPDIWTAQRGQITDRWSYDFGKLLDFAGGKDIGRAVLYGSRPPKNDTLWKMAEAKGFQTVVHDRNASNKEKKVDTNMAMDITEDSFASMKKGKDEVVLVAGDSDYVPVVERLIERGFEVHVVFWDHAARELREKATSFTSLNPQFAHLTR